MVCKHITDTFQIHLTHLALLSSLPTPSAGGLTQRSHDFHCYGLTHECSSYTSSLWNPANSLAGVLIFEQFSELFTISFTILYKTFSRHFFITFNFLSSLSYFVTFPHWFADGSVMSQHIIIHFLNEWISKLTKTENSLNADVSKGLKLK